MDERKTVLSALKNKIFKVLPLKEEGNPHLSVYVESLRIYVEGMMSLSSWESMYADLHEIVCVLLYLTENDCGVSTYRREVFRLLHNIDRMITEMGEAHD